MADVIIRQAGPADAADIFEIERICFPDPWSMDSIRYELEENEKAFYLVAEHSDKVVGYMGLWWILDEGHITNVAVQPGYRNRKIAEGIIRVMLEHTISAGILHHTLEVRRDNSPAINLYKKFGFEVDGVRKGYYQFDGTDALIMWRHATDEEIAELVPKQPEEETEQIAEEASEGTAKAAAETLEETDKAAAETPGETDKAAAETPGEAGESGGQPAGAAAESEEAEERDAADAAEVSGEAGEARPQPAAPLLKQRPKRHRSKK